MVRAKVCVRYGAHVRALFDRRQPIIGEHLERRIAGRLRRSVSAPEFRVKHVVDDQPLALECRRGQLRANCRHKIKFVIQSAGVELQPEPLDLLLARLVRADGVRRIGSVGSLFACRWTGAPLQLFSQNKRTHIALSRYGA